MSRPICVFLIIFLVALSGCATPIGLLYTETNAPVAVTESQAGNKVGEACAYSFAFGLFAVGDRSTEAARRNGGISMLSSVDQSISGVPFIFAKYCTIARGR